MMSIYSLRPFFFFFLGLSVCSSSRVGLREKSIPDEVSGIKDLEERLFHECEIDG